MQDRDQRFDNRQRGRQARDQAVQGYAVESRSFGEVQKVEGRVKGFVGGAHREEDRLARVVQAHDRIAGHVDELVAAFPWKRRKRL